MLLSNPNNAHLILSASFYKGVCLEKCWHTCYVHLSKLGKPSPPGPSASFDVLGPFQFLLFLVLAFIALSFGFGADGFGLISFLLFPVTVSRGRVTESEPADANALALFQLIFTVVEPRPAAYFPKVLLSRPTAEKEPVQSISYPKQTYSR